MSGREQLEFQQIYLKCKTLFLLEPQLLLLELIKSPYKALSLPNQFFFPFPQLSDNRGSMSLPKMTELYWAWRRSQVAGASPGAADGQAHPPQHFELDWNRYGFSAEGIRITETVNLQWSCACPVSALTGMVIAGQAAPIPLSNQNSVCTFDKIQKSRPEHRSCRITDYEVL